MKFAASEREIEIEVLDAARIHFTSSSATILLPLAAAILPDETRLRDTLFPFHPGKRRLFALSRELIDIVDLLARRDRSLTFLPL